MQLRVLGSNYDWTMQVSGGAVRRRFSFLYACYCIVTVSTRVLKELFCHYYCSMVYHLDNIVQYSVVERLAL